MSDGVTSDGAESNVVVRVPASSANLGAGFDVLGMALDLYADVGSGDAPPGALQLDSHHPASIAYSRSGGHGPLWLRCSIPMARGLGFSGAVRVGGAALAVAKVASGDATSIERRAADIMRITSELEGHGDNVAASIHGGVVASIDGVARPLNVGPVLSAARIVVWIPDVTTSTDRSRAALPADVERGAAVHNLGRVVQFVLAVEHDDPELFEGATSDRLHQAERLGLVPGASDALTAGASAGAWCGWLSGSGPTVAFLCGEPDAERVAAAVPEHGQCKTLCIDTLGARVIGSLR